MRNEAFHGIGSLDVRFFQSLPSESKMCVSRCSSEYSSAIRRNL